MVIHAISLYDAVLFVHILAVVVAFGVTFTYGLLDACARRAGIADMVALHRFQVFLSRLLLTPAMVVVLVAGLYLTFDGPYELGDPWIGATLTILIVIFGFVGAVLTPAERRMLAIAQRGAQAGGLGDEYARRRAQVRGLRRARLAARGGRDLPDDGEAGRLIAARPGRAIWKESAAVGRNPCHAQS